MANLNYVLLERVTVGETAVSSITFNSIPQTGYTDLKVVASTRDTQAGADSSVFSTRFNGVTTAIYSNRWIYGSGAAAGSGSYSAQTRFLFGNAGESAGNTASTFSNIELYIPNYTSANYKSVSADMIASENNSATAYMFLEAGLWQSTAAITSISVTPNTSWVQYSSFSLYGLAAVGTTPTRAPKASGGSIIQTDGTYWYHAFLASGTFTPAVGLTCDYLVVAGGGSGGGNGGYAGGGGAGGLRSTVTATGGGGTLESALSLLSGTGYTVTIGAGGSGTGTGSNGSNSVFSTITSTGGGEGGYYNAGDFSPTSGGSGGGSRTGAVAGAAGTANQGYKGGDQATSKSGAGGGAGAVGQNATGTGAVGGAGVAITALATPTSTGASGYYAGGGGGSSQSFAGGAGGAGGGGAAGADSVIGTAGTPNTGGGGGGSGGLATAGGKGGSGIVIIRYAV